MQTIQTNSIRKDGTIWPTFSSRMLSILLEDKSTGKNLRWATNDYLSLGEDYSSSASMMVRLISGKAKCVIRPRTSKGIAEQQARSHEKAEVFTPSWVCNAQNNLVDKEWFGHETVFNREQGEKWRTNYKRVIFSKKTGKTWQDYVTTNRLEIACGEAPYLTSRYDAVSGRAIPVKMRIGILDRKLRIVSENTDTAEAWLQWAKCAIQSVYGFDWQGDNVLLARENILLAFIEAYEDCFHQQIPESEIISIAKIIVWNIWQMDGNKFVVPETCHPMLSVLSFLGDEILLPCDGCNTGNRLRHNGIYCRIMDWKKHKSIRFVDLLKEDRI